MSMPWIYIPKFAEPGQTHAFANREAQTQELYNSVVSAGNAVRKGRRDVRQKLVVSGYKGVGKSMLILQVLGLIRNEAQAWEAQQKTLLRDLVDPIDRERWVVLRVSGKHVANIEALADNLGRAIVGEPGATEATPKEPLIPLLADLHEQAADAAQRALELKIPILDRLLRKREVGLYERVRSALVAVAESLQHVQNWSGAVQSDRQERSSSTQLARGVEVHAETKLETQGPASDMVEGNLGARLAADVTKKTAHLLSTSSNVERQWRVSAEQVVVALNRFFAAATAASIPTILVLDDFDEVTSSIGPSVEERFRALSTILGPFGELKPTCLILSLRQEYMHEDILRGFNRIHVPPMTPEAATAAIERWAEVQHPAPSRDEVENLKALGARLLGSFQRTEPIVIPLPFLQLVAWIANSGAGAEDNALLLQRYLEVHFMPEEARLILRLVDAMPDDDVLRCAAASPLDAAPYALTPMDRRTLTQAGLLRPAMAGDPEDTRIVIDPLCAYLRVARKHAAR